jgi:hypothetical protein
MAHMGPGDPGAALRRSRREANVSGNVKRRLNAKRATAPETANGYTRGEKL